MNDTELVAKLRESGPFTADDGYMSIKLPEHHDAHVAADRIEELSADNERLRAFAQEQGLAISDLRRMYGAGDDWPSRAEDCWNEMQGGPMGELLYPDNP